MEKRSLENIHPMDSEEIWFECKCGIKYNDSLEEIISPENIKGSIEWAHTPTSYENRWDALTKLTTREEYENKKCKSKRKSIAEPSER